MSLEREDHNRKQIWRGGRSWRFERDEEEREEEGKKLQRRGAAGKELPHLRLHSAAVCCSLFYIKVILAAAFLHSHSAAGSITAVNRTEPTSCEISSDRLDASKFLLIKSMLIIRNVHFWGVIMMKTFNIMKKNSQCCRSASSAWKLNQIAPGQFSKSLLGIIIHERRKKETMYIRPRPFVLLG